MDLFSSTFGCFYSVIYPSNFGWSEVCSDANVAPALQPLDGEPYCNWLLPIVKMVPVLMLLPGIFGVKIGSVRFSMSGFSTLLRTLIFAPNCPDVTSFMNMKKDGHMMSMLERLRELAFHHWCLHYWWHGTHCYNSF